MRVRRWIQAALLLILGLYFLDNMVSGQISFYVNERFIWLSWLGTGLLLALGTIRVVDLLREPRTAEVHEDHEGHDHHDHDEHHHHDHDHDHGHDHGDHSHAVPSWPVLGIISVPLILGLLVPAKPLGAAALATNGISSSYSNTQSSGATELTIAPTDRNVLDWVRAFNSTDKVDTFTGMPADIIGFVYRDTRFTDKTQMMVARFAISCCVADASAIGVVVQSPDAPKFDQDSWVHVKGKFVVQDLGGQKTPILVADTLEATDQPAHPYLYP